MKQGWVVNLIYYKFYILKKKCNTPSILLKEVYCSEILSCFSGSKISVAAGFKERPCQVLAATDVAVGE